jgi:hypothetical protein
VRSVPLLTALLVAVAWPTVSGAAPAARPSVAVRMNEIQVLGTHNSYHLRPANRQVRPGEPADYTHPSLTVQLDSESVRSFEIDIFKRTDLPVLHTPLIDDTSNCKTLEACLTELATWQDAHPRHVPIFVLIEPKTQSIVIDNTLTPWDAAGLEHVDEVIRSVFHGRSLLTPDDVRGRSRTLREAVTKRGWPTLAKARGRVAVVLNTQGPLRDAYLAGHETLQKRAMFVPADPRAPSAAFVKRDNPIGRHIERLVRQGFIVRTLADDAAVEARANDHTRADIAIRAGTQIVSTDYPVADPVIGPYTVRVAPGRLPAACNPVNAPRSCRDKDLER